MKNYDHAFYAMRERFVEQQRLGTQGWNRW